MWWVELLNSFVSVLDSGGAGGGGGAFESISTQTLGSTSTSITFSSIPSTYKHLQLRMRAGSSAGASDTFGIRFNGDTGSNYAAHGIRGDGSAVTANGYFNDPGMTFFILGGSTNWGVSIIDVHDYAETTKNKTIRNIAGYDANGSGTIALGSGLWRSTAAVNSLTIYNMSFATGSVFSLYGIKGA